jgi:hypothetical protein
MRLESNAFWRYEGGVNGLWILVTFDWVRGATFALERTLAELFLCLVGEMECLLPKPAEPLGTSCVDEEARITLGW